MDHKAVFLRDIPVVQKAPLLSWKFLQLLAICSGTLPIWALTRGNEHQETEIPVVQSHYQSFGRSNHSAEPACRSAGDCGTSTSNKTLSIDGSRGRCRVFCRWQHNTMHSQAATASLDAELTAAIYRCQHNPAKDCDELGQKRQKRRSRPRTRETVTVRSICQTLIDFITKVARGAGLRERLPC